MIPAHRRQLPSLIVGAGPIGLAAAAHASSRGLPTLVLEAGPAVGVVGARVGSRPALLARGESSSTPPLRRCWCPRAGGVPTRTATPLAGSGWRTTWRRSPSALVATGQVDIRVGRRVVGIAKAGPRPSGGLRPGREPPSRCWSRTTEARRASRRAPSSTRRAPGPDPTRWALTACPRSGSCGRRPDRLRHPGLRRPGRCGPATPASAWPSRAGAPRRRTPWSAWPPLAAEVAGTEVVWLLRRPGHR